MHSLRFQNRKLNVRQAPRFVEDLLGSGLVIGVLGLIDVGNEFLRVAVDKREPGTLDLDHYSVAFFEGVRDSVQVDCVGYWDICRHRLGLNKAVSKPCSNDFHVDRKLITR